MNAVENDGRLPRRQQPAFSVGVAVRGVTALNTRSSPHRNSLPERLSDLEKTRIARGRRPVWKLLTYVQVVEWPGWAPYRSRQYINTDRHIMPLLYRCLPSKSPTRYVPVCADPAGLLKSRARIRVTRAAREASSKRYAGFAGALKLSC